MKPVRPYDPAVLLLASLCGVMRQQGDPAQTLECPDCKARLITCGTGARYCTGERSGGARHPMRRMREVQE